MSRLRAFAGSLRLVLGLGGILHSLVVLTFAVILGRHPMEFGGIVVVVGCFGMGVAGHIVSLSIVNGRLEF
jgi:hypothetical protein